MKVYHNISQLREVLKEVPKYYKNKNWQRKVDKMTDSQVIAVYLSFRKRGLI